MAEVDTKPPIESVQAAISLFGEKCDQRKSRPSSPEEPEKEKKIEMLEKELANLRVYSETKDYACKQALHSLDQYQEMADQLLAQLISHELERDIYMNECIDAKFHLESRITDKPGRVSSLEQHSCVASELSATREKLLSLERELAISSNEKVESMARVELMGNALAVEMANSEELLRQVAQLHKTIMDLKLTGDVADKVANPCQTGPEVPSIASGVTEALERLVCIQEQLDIMHNLENQICEKSEFIYSLQLELHQVNELHSSSQQAVSDANRQLDQLKADLQLQERKFFDQAGYINLLEIEFKQLNQELMKSSEEISHLNISAEQMKGELEKTRSEMVEISAKESEAQAELSLLKCELNIWRSRTSEADSENRLMEPKVSESATDNDDHVVISRGEYGILMKKAQESEKRMGSIHENNHEVLILKKELDIATSRVSELRTRAEQAISRAEAAEKAKTELAEQIQRRKKQKERRKAALAALREESISREEINSFNDDNAHKHKQSLGKVLNMKF